MQEKLQELIFRLERMSADEVPKEWVLSKLKEMVEVLPSVPVARKVSVFNVDDEELDYPSEKMVDVHVKPPEIPFCVMIPNELGVGETFIWQGRTYRLFSDGLHPIDTK